MQLLNEATQMEHDNRCEYAKIWARPLQLISVSYPDTRRKRMNKSMKNLNRIDCNLIHSLSAGLHSLELLYFRHIRTRNTTATFPRATVQQTYQVSQYYSHIPQSYCISDISGLATLQPHSLELLFIRHIRSRNTTATFPRATVYQTYQYSQYYSHTSSQAIRQK